jgi:hypothetical protein
MSLFEFELTPVERIEPWGEPGNQTLSWFALSLGEFWCVLGETTLFEYSPEILTLWGLASKYADYQVAAFARDILSAAAAGASALPPNIERMASSWETVDAILSVGSSDEERRHYAAGRWVGERSPWTSYLTANPRFTFVRVGNDVSIHWDNRECVEDGVQVWTAKKGTYSLSVEAFRAECRDFVSRLLAAMGERIAAIEAHRAVPRVPVDLASLRVQHETWRREFEGTLANYRPDVPWEEAEAAMVSIAQEQGIELP